MQYALQFKEVCLKLNNMNTLNLQKCFTLALFGLLLASLSPGAATETINIAMPESFKPYTYEVDGQWRGIDLDIARELHKRMGLDVHYQSMPWARQLAHAEKGLSAGVLTMYCNDKKTFLEVTEESFYQIKISLFARKETIKQLDIRSLNDLPQGSVVGIVRSNFFAPQVEKHSNLSVSYSHNTPILTQQLYLKRIDYVMEEYLPFMFYSKESGYSDDIVEVMVYLTDEVCTGFSKSFFGEQAQSVAQQASELIQQLKAEGYIDRVIQQYIHLQ